MLPSSELNSNSTPSISNAYSVPDTFRLAVHLYLYLGEKTEACTARFPYYDSRVPSLRPTTYNLKCQMQPERL